MFCYNFGWDTPGILVFNICFAGRVLFEFDCDTPFQTIIYRGSFKRLNIALMLVKGEDHRYPAKVSFFLIVSPVIR